MEFDQSEYDVRCEWGLHGVRTLSPASDVVIVVDLLSFSTAVDIAVANGASVLPYRWRDDSAKEFALARGALLASPRSSHDGYSLSPASLESIPAQTALVLPSPNGSTLCLSTGKAVTITACLRNCEAVAARAQSYGTRIAVVAAGEQWSDGSLRFSIEDLIGAGAVIRALSGRRSPEAELAVAAFERFRDNLHDTIAGSSSGSELVARGFARDVELAAEYSCSHSVPVLNGDRFGCSSADIVVRS